MILICIFLLLVRTLKTLKEPFQRKTYLIFLWGLNYFSENLAIVFLFLKQYNNVLRNHFQHLLCIILFSIKIFRDQIFCFSKKEKLIEIKLPSLCRYDSIPI